MHVETNYGFRAHELRTIEAALRAYTAYLVERIETIVPEGQWRHPAATIEETLEEAKRLHSMVKQELDKNEDR